VQCFIGGLLGQGTVSQEELQQRVDQHNEEIRQQVQQQLNMLQRLGQLPPSKRAKGTPTD
jgi:ferritin-like metal-binding protein YciE